MLSNFPVGTTGTFEVKADGSIDIKANIPGKKWNTTGLYAYRVVRGPLTRPLTGPDIIGRFTGIDGFIYFISPSFGDDLMRRYRFQELKGILTSDYEIAQKKQCEY